jgi:hypothetical protein
MHSLRLRGFRRPSIGLAVASLLAVQSSPALATDIGLAFGSLPTAQGWTYTTGGVAAPETPIWSVSGGVLSYDTMPYNVGLSGQGTTSFYAQLGVVNSFEPIVILMRGRILAFENDGSASIGGGFNFGFTQGTTLWAMCITPTQIRNVNGVVLSSAYDNTVFHDYRLEWTPPSTVRYYVDNTLISTNNAGFAQALNRIYFGDSTGAANARAEITYYRFLQGAATPAVSTSWGGVKSLYR